MKKHDSTVATSDIRPEDRVPLKEKLCYGAGGLMDGGGVALISVPYVGCVVDGECGNHIHTHKRRSVHSDVPTVGAVFVGYDIALYKAF